MELRDLIAAVFESHGFDMVEGSFPERYILATKGSINLSVGYRLDGDVVGKKELLGFIGLSTNDDAHRHIFISFGGLSEEAEELAREADVEVWDSEQFQREVGRAVIGAVRDGAAFPGLPGTSGDGEASPLESGGPPPPRPVPLDPTRAERLLTGYPPFSADPDSGLPPPVAAPATPPAPGTSYANGLPGRNGGEVEEPDAVPEGMESRIMKIHLSRPDAQALSSKIEGYRFDLQLIPYYIFDYTCDVTVEGDTVGETQRNSGTIGINALTLRHEQWPTSYETVRDLDIPHTKLEFRHTFAEARDVVDAAVITLNTTVIETVEERESATVIERKKVRPNEDAVEVVSRGVVYLPVWCIEGNNGVMIIDGASGNILKEETFRSRETVML